MHDITENTILVVVRDWITPYNHYMRGDHSSAKYWAYTLGQNIEVFIKDFNNGGLDMWFKIYHNQ